jgi:4-hydroxybenzoate polyprenyltransferase
LHDDLGQRSRLSARAVASSGKQQARMNELEGRVADASGNWVDSRAPAWARPYLRLARLDRPIGSWLLLMPCWWSAALAGGIIGDLYGLPLTLGLFLVGAFAMRGAGCTWNDITDRDLDAMVERTRSRPIPAGQVSVPQAAVFLVLQSLIGLAVLVQFNRFAISVGMASLVIVAIYPFMKRITWWPQIVLGLAFSWGALMGFAATLGRIDATAVALYAGSIAWVIGYDTIYAHQDAEDDALIGIKSTARLFGPRTRPALFLFYGAAVALIGLALALAGTHFVAWLGFAAFAVHLGWQIWRLDIANPVVCLRLFKSNRDAGLLLFAGLLIDTVMSNVGT